MTLSLDELKDVVGVSVDVSMILKAAGKPKHIAPFMDMCKRIQGSDRTKGIQIRTMVQYLTECIEDLD